MSIQHCIRTSCFGRGDGLEERVQEATSGCLPPTRTGLSYNHAEIQRLVFFSRIRFVFECMAGIDCHYV